MPVGGACGQVSLRQDTPLWGPRASVQSVFSGAGEDPTPEPPAGVKRGGEQGWQLPRTKLLPMGFPFAPVSGLTLPSVQPVILKFKSSCTVYLEGLLIKGVE